MVTILGRLQMVTKEVPRSKCDQFKYLKMARKSLKIIFFLFLEKKSPSYEKFAPKKKKKKKQKDQLVGTSYNISNLQFKFKHYNLKSMLQCQVIPQTKYYNVI